MAGPGGWTASLWMAARGRVTGGRDGLRTIWKLMLYLRLVAEDSGGMVFYSQCSQLEPLSEQKRGKAIQDILLLQKIRYQNQTFLVCHGHTLTCCQGPVLQHRVCWRRQNGLSKKNSFPS
jgi:hypothetical protein